jgi:hypothetical protein
MKKIGFLVLALVLVLGTMGIGFSMWTSSVQVNGQVDTGNVKLTVSNPTGTWVYKDESLPPGSGDASEVWVWAYQQVDGSGNPILPPVPNLGDVIYSAAWPGTTPVNWSDNNVNYAWTAITGFGTDINGNPTVTASTYNLFPVVAFPFDPSIQFATFDADFDVTNSGTVPVKLVINPPPSDIGGVTVQVGFNNGGSNPYNGSNDYNLSDLQGMQIDPGQHVHMLIGFTPDEGTTQSFNGSFTFSIQGVQWNEYSP